MRLELIPIETDRKSLEKYLQHEFCTHVFNEYEKFYPKNGFNYPWIGYFALYQDEVAGVGGYKRSPKNGKIEIAYGSVPGKEGHRFASEICRSLTKIAIEEVPDA